MTTMTQDKMNATMEEKTKSKKIMIPEIKMVEVELELVGLSPYISHKWSEKAIRMMAEKHAGNKTKVREIRDEAAQAEEVEAAMYRDASGKPGFPAMALKNSMVGFAHDKESVPKTLVRKAIFIQCTDPLGVIAFSHFDSVSGRQDTVRVGTGTDLRYRPMFDGWRAVVRFQINESLISVKDLVSLVNCAGFSVGIGEWRPEKNGDFGRFEVVKNGSATA